MLKSVVINATGFTNPKSMMDVYQQIAKKDMSVLSLIGLDEVDLRPGSHVCAITSTDNFDTVSLLLRLAGLDIRDQLVYLFDDGGKLNKWQIILARKPLEGTVVDNVLKYTTGALNIDACRVPINPEIDDPRLGGQGEWSTKSMAANAYGSFEGKTVSSSPDGRWPANVIHDGSQLVTSLFPDAKGQQGYVGPEHGNRDSINCYGDYGQRPATEPRVETNKNASRFFNTVAGRDNQAKMDALVDHMITLTTA